MIFDFFLMYSMSLIYMTLYIRSFTSLRKRLVQLGVFSLAVVLNEEVLVFMI